MATNSKGTKKVAKKKAPSKKGTAAAKKAWETRRLNAALSEKVVRLLWPSGKNKKKAK